jgi:hypothetical protein
VDTPPSWSGLLQLAVVIVAASIIVRDCSDRAAVAEMPSPSCRTSDRDRASGSIYFLLHWLLLLVVRVVGFTMITVVTMDVWRHSAIERKKLRRLRLAILHRILVVLVLEYLRGILLV